jgi:flavin-dependent dehydrogenase
MQRQNPHLSAWLEQAERIHQRWITIAQIPFGPKLAVDRDVIMAGDAAGLIVPLAGDGISMALEGGQMAAQWVMRYLEGNVDAAHLRAGYARAWSDCFAFRLRLGRALQPLLLNPRMTGAALRLLGMVPRVGAALVGRTRGRIQPAGSGQPDRLWTE